MALTMGINPQMRQTLHFPLPSLQLSLLLNLALGPQGSVTLFQEGVSEGLGATQTRVFILILPWNQLCDLRQVPSPLWALVSSPIRKGMIVTISR